MKDKELVSPSLNTSDGSAPYIESLYESFLKDPKSIPEDWRIYFETLPSEPTDSERYIA